MPKHVGKKYRTLHKFGKRRKKTKGAVQCNNTPQKLSVAESPASTTRDVFDTSTVDDGGAMPSSTSSVLLSSVASQRKSDFFESRKRRYDSRDDESDDNGEFVEEGAESTDTPASADLNVIVNIGCLQSLVTESGVLCPNCQQPRLTVLEGGKGFRHGSACLLELHCTECGKLSAEWTSKKSGTIDTGYDINRRIVAAATASGMSFSQVKKLFTLMGMPAPMSETSWYFLKKQKDSDCKAGSGQASARGSGVGAEDVC